MMVEAPEVHEPCQYFKDRSKFIELPCGLGDKVFYFDTAGRIYEQTIFQFIYGGTGLKLDSDVMFDSELIGKRFFLSREEAEKVLKERDNFDPRAD
ncbi:MAG: hypothetical protein IIU14_07900 [Ruminococcus sp.]|nr:hypothetical protein [Ruminococcus sp.]